MFFTRRGAWTGMGGRHVGTVGHDGGHIVDYVILDAHGHRVQITTSRRTAANGGTACWKCGKAEDGSLHRWIVPCPVIRDSVTTGTLR